MNRRLARILPAALATVLLAVPAAVFAFPFVWMLTAGFKHDAAMSDADCTLDYVLRHLPIYGTPETVAAKIEELRREVGPFGTLLYVGHDWHDPALARRSMTLMATEVMPRVNKALGEG